MTFCWPSSAALFPLGDRPVQVGTIDPHPAQSGWPDNREIAGCDQIAQRPGADAAVRFRSFEVEKPSRCGARLFPAQTIVARRGVIALVLGRQVSDRCFHLFSSRTSRRRSRTAQRWARPGHQPTKWCCSPPLRTRCRPAARDRACVPAPTRHRQAAARRSCVGRR